MTTRQAAMESGLLQRTVQKYIARYKKIGDRAFVHGNLGKKRFSPEVEEKRKRVENIFLNTRVNGKNPFENITYAMFKVILEEEFNLKAGRTWLVKVLNGLGYRTPAKHRGAKEAVHTYRPRKAHEGELMQADGTSFDWFKDGKIHCIQGFVDDATGCPYLYMTKNECLLGYVEAFRSMAADKGIPKAIYPDKASVFFVNNKKDDGERHLTQFGVMMENMGGRHVPRAQPAGERPHRALLADSQAQASQPFRPERNRHGGKGERIPAGRIPETVAEVVPGKASKRGILFRQGSHERGERSPQGDIPRQG